MRLIAALAILSLFPETPLAEDNHNRHNGRIQQRNAAIETDLLRGEKPIRGVRKMSSDEGEKFYLDYWGFHDSEGLSMCNHTDVGNDDNHDNGVQPRSYPYQPTTSVNMARELFLFQRDFQCPSGTTSCTSINRPSSCCASGDTCELVQDTGSGDVGCCPQGQTCSGVIGSCPSEYTACPVSLGGGCCIPGFECVSGGCAYVSTVTVTLHSTVFVSTKTYTTPPSSNVPSVPSSTSTSKTSSDDLAPPARPTSLSTATTSQSGSETGSICPTGFYACSAVYQGGCCRTGRDCDTTSCPTTSSTTAVSNNDETIVAPAVTTSTATCASGWFGCDESMGGGCCPTGFSCGSASCTATAEGGSVSATGTVAKEETSGVSGRRFEDGRMLLIVLAIMLVLVV